MVAIALIVSTMAVIYVAASVFLPPGKPRIPPVRPPEPEEIPLPERALMSRDEALAILGLDPMASRLDVQSAYLDIMKKIHPDHPGGNDWMASKVNQARTVLMESLH
jgi:hypothetical protein